MTGGTTSASSQNLGRDGARLSMITKSLCAFFESGGPTLQIRQRFAGEMK
jgi:hypothetical protein